MAATQQATVLIGTFADSSAARRFVEELKRTGFRDDQIGVAAPREETGADEVEEGAVAGMVTGGAWGALLGTAIAAGLVPGVGPVMSAGLLAGIFGGAAAGAAAGGLVGALIGLGMSEDEARQYEHHLRAGRTLVIVKGNGRLAEAGGILNRLRADTAKEA